MSFLQHCSLLTLLVLFLFFQIPVAVLSFQYKVGDLDSWGVPPPSKPGLYSLWSKNHNFTIGDSLLFLYPPSQDSVIQVTERAYNTCATSDPLRKMTDGNSVFNITAPGTFFFISGNRAHCQKHQRMQIRVPSADGKFFPPPGADAPAPAAAGPSSYANAFGPMPMGLGSGAGSGAAGGLGISGVAGAVGSVIAGLFFWILV
ncbi:putative mavicyanin [Iris pallida]|uniref:Mavicyanin n=1 Tax=Iris pallida TaxID=29817 RepID=A0AAX6H3Q1_IRIPA|nr:putative mavicyanin [Iris pallida]